MSRLAARTSVRPAHRGAPRQPPLAHNSIIHSPSSNSFQFSSVMMRTSLRRPWVQGAPQSNSSSTATGTTRLLGGAMSTVSPLHSKRGGPHLRAAAPHFRLGGLICSCARPHGKARAPRGFSTRMRKPCPGWLGREREKRAYP